MERRRAIVRLRVGSAAATWGGGSEAVRLLTDDVGHASYTAVVKAVMPPTNAINILVQSVPRQGKVTVER